jgi:signal transduction histidine kinase/DNA-binding response OmpR family regulator
MRILLIDDSLAYREEFAVMLADAGITPAALDVATTLEQGARMMAAAGHDIYIIDYRLPGGDGLDLVRDARRAGMTAPIIVLTGYGSPAIDSAAEQAGATDYLSKGEFSPGVLSRVIRYAMRNAEALKAAREAEARFRLAQEVTGIGTWDWDIRANTILWSGPMRAMYGLDPERSDPVSYDRWRLAVLSEDRQKAVDAVDAALAGRAPYDLLFRILRRDPARPHAAPVLRWIAAKGDVLRDANGTAYRMVGTNMDVTDQQNVLAILEARNSAAAAGLWASEVRFKTYFDSAIECLFHISRDAGGAFRYHVLNRVGLERACKTLDEVVGRTPVEVLGPDAGGIMEAALARVYDTGNTVLFEPTYNLPKGPIVFEAIYTPLRDESGAVTGVLGSARDITGRLQLEASLRQAQKMEALGQLAGGVAHDFNNLLAGIQGCFRLLGRQPLSERGQNLVAEGLRSVERSTALTARLLSFSRPKPLKVEAVDINASLGEISGMLSRTLGGDLRIEKALAADLWPAVVDRDQIELAILNLGINARDAMPAGGRLTISTRNETVPEPRDGLAAGDYVAIAMTDTGVGMAPEVLAHVREPFFTTKPAGKGTGLGLSMVAGIVEEFDGGLTITSEPGRGTCVTLLLPRVAAEAPAVLPARILLVDGDPDTQAAITAYAADPGHVVTVAGSVEEALSLLEAERDVDMMIVDGGMRYAELVAQASQRRPGLPVLVVSGSALESGSAGVPVLAKPIGQSSFNRAVAALTGNRAAVAELGVEARPRLVGE